MFISHKSNVIQQIADADWDCRRKTKGSAGRGINRLFSS